MCHHDCATHAATSQLQVVKNLEMRILLQECLPHLSGFHVQTVHLVHLSMDRAALFGKVMLLTLLTKQLNGQLIQDNIGKVQLVALQ